MSEMLANQYFLVRNFISAKTLYENILVKDPMNKSIKKKLTICYVTTGEIDKALNVFLSLIKEDIDYVINTDINSEDCACRKIISQIENEEKLYTDEKESLTALGILWLYCSLDKSIYFFKQVKIKNPDDKKIREINSILTHKLIANKNNLIN